MPNGVTPTTVIRSVLVAPFTLRTLREQAYLLVVGPVGFVSLGVTLLLLAIGAGLSVFLIGVPMVAMGMLAARHLGDARRSILASLLDEQVPAPPPVRPWSGLRGWLVTSFTDAPAWRALAYMVVSTPIVCTGFYVAVMAWISALIALASPVVWQVVDPVNVGPDGVEHHSLIQFGDYYIETWPRALAVAGAGLLLVFAIPWFVRGVVWIDRSLARALLGPGQTTARMRALEDTRSQAVDESAAALRRIERDLHDGTQARLVALAMQLDMVREKLAADAPTGVEGALELVDTAHRNATDAITELREVTRSIHPPALDRGLDAALATLAARSAVPAMLHADIRQRPSAAIETIAYFCVAELLANVARHSGATLATVDVSQQVDGGLRIRVGDNGQGGARLTAGHGLAGLSDRLRTVDGRLGVDSPPGGPTAVTVELPSSAGPGPGPGG